MGTLEGILGSSCVFFCAIRNAERLGALYLWGFKQHVLARPRFLVALTPLSFSVFDCRSQS